MVFCSGSGSLPEASSFNSTGPVVDTVMASGSSSSAAISKSPQPLHNFTLPDNLKWSFSHSPHRFRYLMLADSPSPQAQRPLSEIPDVVVRVSDEKRKTVMVCDEFQGQAHVGNTLEEGSSERKSNKILVRMSNTSKTGDEAREGGAAEALAVAVNGEGGGGEEAARKTWNFRPRKPLVKKQPSGVTNVPKGGSGEAVVKRPQVQSQAMGNNGKKKKKKENKQKLYVSLSRQEIEEDIYAMTGSKPSRRPKKRAKAAQKLVDNLFPGMCLYNISPDAYGVPDPPLKN